MESLAAVSVLYALVAYLVCGIPFGLVVSRAHGVDVRATGSGNIGATNVGRSVGAGAAALTLALDAGKGLLCTALARGVIAAATGLAPAAFACETPFGWSLTLVYAGCVLGHVFSPYLRLHGGKGISVGFGAALGLDWRVALGLLAVFLVAALPSRYVSLGSSLAAVSLPVWCVALGYSVQAVVPMVVVACCVVWAHRGNIDKLVHGREKRFSFHHDAPSEGGGAHE